VAKIVNSRIAEDVDSDVLGGVVEEAAATEEEAALTDEEAALEDAGVFPIEG